MSKHNVYSLLPLGRTDRENMIITTVKLRGREEKRKEILQTISGLTDQVRLLKGCLSVNSYQDINDENIFYHVEEWQTQQELDDYLNSNLFSALLGIKTILVEKPTVDFMTTGNIERGETDAVHPFMIRVKE